MFELSKKIFNIFVVTPGVGGDLPPPTVVTPPPSIYIFFKLVVVGMFFFFLGFRGWRFVSFVYIVVSMVFFFGGGGGEGTCEKGSVRENVSIN